MSIETLVSNVSNISVSIRLLKFMSLYVYKHLCTCKNLSLEAHLGCSSWIGSKFRNASFLFKLKEHIYIRKFVTIIFLAWSTKSIQLNHWPVPNCWFLPWAAIVIACVCISSGFLAINLQFWNTATASPKMKSMVPVMVQSR